MSYSDKYNMIFNDIKGIFECSRGDVLEVIERTFDYSNNVIGSGSAIPSYTENVVYRCTKGDIIDLLSSGKYYHQLFGSAGSTVIFTDISKVVKINENGFRISYSVYSGSTIISGDLIIDDLPGDIRNMKLNKMGI